MQNRIYLNLDNQGRLSLLSQYSPYFHKIYQFPVLENVLNSPIFQKKYKFHPIFCLIYIVFCLIYFFSSPYFDYDAFIHHALYILDVSV